MHTVTFGAAHIAVFKFRWDFQLYPATTGNESISVYLMQQIFDLPQIFLARTAINDKTLPTSAHDWAVAPARPDYLVVIRMSAFSETLDNGKTTPQGRRAQMPERASSYSLLIVYGPKSIKKSKKYYCKYIVVINIE